MIHESIPVGSILGNRDILEREDAVKIRNKVFQRFYCLEPQTVVALDFDCIRFIDAVCAEVILGGIMRRLMIDEYPGVFAILTNLKDQHRGNISLALSTAKKTMIIAEGNPERWSFTGELLESYAKALNWVMINDTATSRELGSFMKYPKVTESSTKLSWLYSRRLLARESAGGRNRAFRYIALI